MSTHQTAKTRYVSANDEVNFAYRRLGSTMGTPLLFLNHYRATMDHWDPVLINAIAATRNVILYDYPGLGQSTGPIASTIKQMADDVFTFLQLIKVDEIDVLGFSIGGMVTQLVGLNADPTILRVRKLILAGTGPSGGPDFVPTPNGEGLVANATVEHLSLLQFQTLFFPKTVEGTQASEGYWARIHERSKTSSGEEHSTFLSDGLADGGKGMETMLQATSKFFDPQQSEGLEGSYHRLIELRMPVLVANGHDDYMLPSINSWVIQQKVPRGKLIIYPDSGHGFLFQYSVQFARDVLNFLEE